MITIWHCIISSVMHAFWLVLTYDLSEDRRIDHDSARFKFYICVILWTNHKSLLSIATNQFASFCIHNRLRESAIFVSVSDEIWNKKAFLPYILILYYIKQIDSMLPCVCSVIDHRGRQNLVRTSVTHSAALRLSLFCSYQILTSSVIYYWTDARQHGIYLLDRSSLMTFYSQGYHADLDSPVVLVVQDLPEKVK